MRQGDSEKTGLLNDSSVGALKRQKPSCCNSSTLHRFNGFALYEVLLGVAIFAFGVLALGRAVENCLNASALNAEEGRVRLILANRMAEIQTAPARPEEKKEFNINTGYGVVKLIQTSAPAGLRDENGAELANLQRVTLTAKWNRGGTNQAQQI